MRFEPSARLKAEGWREVDRLVEEGGDLARRGRRRKRLDPEGLEIPFSRLQPDKPAAALSESVLQLEPALPLVVEPLGLEFIDAFARLVNHLEVLIVGHPEPGTDAPGERPAEPPGALQVQSALRQVDRDIRVLRLFVLGVVPIRPRLSIIKLFKVKVPPGNSVLRVVAGDGHAKEPGRVDIRETGHQAGSLHRRVRKDALGFHAFVFVGFVLVSFMRIRRLVAGVRMAGDGVVVGFSIEAPEMV